MLAPRSPATSRLPARTSPRIVCPPFGPRQQASAFNQPLSFDTSSVTTMYGMFYVRALLPCPAFDFRQQASAFNQPLSFDTSKVTTMYYMFYVRSAPFPAPDLQSSPPLHAACTVVARHPPA